MLFLGLLAMADWQGGVPVADRAAVPLSALDRYQLAAGEQTLRPRLSIVKAVHAQDTEVGDIADQPLLRNLRQLFGVSYQYESGLEAERLEREYWQPVLAQVPGIDQRAGRLWAFDGITPTEVNLGANITQSFRQDLYTMLLGQGNNQWSNLQLAQAMGRLLLGAPESRAHLVERVTRPSDADADAAPTVLWQLPTTAAPNADADTAVGERWPLREEDRRLVLQGMAAVVERPAGTAYALSAPLAELNGRAPHGVSYRLFAKTGTPTSSPALLRRRGTLPDDAAIVEHAAGRQAQSAMLVLGVERSAPASTPEHLVLVFYIEGQGSGRQAVDLAAEVLQPVIEGRWPQDWLRPQ